MAARAKGPASVMKGQPMPPKQMFPDQRSPLPTRLLIDVEEFANHPEMTSLVVSVRSGRGDVLAYGVTTWVGEEHVDLPRVIEAAYQAFVLCEEAEAPVEIVKEHHRATREALRPPPAA